MVPHDGDGSSCRCRPPNDQIGGLHRLDPYFLPHAKGPSAVDAMVTC